ncbi:hypothetical protein Pmani_012251 [Petrolisthes manimaculis]|uniref:Uncharacterized protein n=1 Tax=Petrolisthes manimaculis TaxID=1843537 RepID=A0AAE1UDF0_9EUCA|nr:hypothetical protein Pmani_012251 [Petrolisthes manimaculis]
MSTSHYHLPPHPPASFHHPYTIYLPLHLLVPPLIHISASTSTYTCLHIHLFFPPSSPSHIHHLNFNNPSTFIHFQHQPTFTSSPTTTTTIIISPTTTTVQSNPFPPPTHT